MAFQEKFPIKHKCGHTQSINLATNKNDKLNRGPVDRPGFAKWLSDAWGDSENGRDCPKCFKASRLQDSELNERQWMLDIEEFETKYHLPELRGTEKMQSSGLVDNARKDRFAVLGTLFDPDESTHMDQHGELLSASRELGWAGFWATHLGVKVRREHEYGQDEYVTLIVDGAAAEAQRKDRFKDSGHIETENPFE